jgi:adenylate kinase family enzyme
MRINRLLAGVSLYAFDDGFIPITPEERRGNVNPVYTEKDSMLKRDNWSVRMLPYWDKTDAIIGGIDSMRDKRQRYLPRFDDESKETYNNRMQLTKMTNIYGDIVDDLSAKPFEKEVSLLDDEENKPPKELLDFIENVDGGGLNITAFAKNVFYNGINSAIDWIFVDYPSNTEQIRTLADAKKAGIRPYWSRVLGRNVISAKEEMILSAATLTYIRLFEPGTPDQIREFVRDPVSGAINWVLYEKREAWDKERQTNFYQIDAGTLSIDVIPLLPFLTGRRDDRTFYIRPMLQSAADLQIDLYQSESGLKYAKTMTGYAMLTAVGIKPELNADGKPKHITVGPSKILYGGRDGAGNAGEWKYIEPNASSLKFLAEDIDSTIKNLRELGKQPLTAQSGNLTVVTTAVAAGKSRTAVGACALNLKNVLENAIVVTCKWLGIDDATYSADVFVFVEFDDVKDNTADLGALAAARTSRDISRKTYLGELVRRDVLPSDFDEEQDMEEILLEIPANEEDDDENNPAA